MCEVMRVIVVFVLQLDVPQRRRPAITLYSGEGVDEIRLATFDAIAKTVK